MKRLFLFLLLSALPAFATHTCGVGVGGGVCYIAANGSDSNSGATTSLPWLHMHGMPSATGNASTQVPQAGDKYVFRGGDTWHFNSGAPGTGGTFAWTASGSAGNAIYIGVDVTYFTGASWVRPIFSFDNPLNSGGQVSSCSFDDTSQQFMTVSANFVTVDNFDWQGYCWAGSPSGAMLNLSGNHLTVTNNYFHGWTMATAASGDGHRMITSGGSSITFNVIASNVFDGSDSTFGTRYTVPSSACPTPGTGVNCAPTTGTPTTGNAGASGWAIAGECYDVHQNVFRHMSNALECNGTTVHDNLFEYMFESANSNPHGNIYESLAGAPISSISAISQSGTLVTVTSNLNPGAGTSNVAITGVSPAGFNGVFSVVSSNSSSFTYNTGSGLGSGSGANMQASVAFYFYNNIIRNNSIGVTIWMSANLAYAFNNVFENDQHNGGAVNQNCFAMSPSGVVNPTVVFYNVANNTLDGTCGMQASAASPQWAAGSTVAMQNMYVIGRTGIFTGTAAFACNGGTCTNKIDNGNNVFQTLAVANAGGYCLVIGGACTASDFAPSSGAGATVGAGGNLSSLVSIYSPADSALGSGTGNGCSEISGSGGLVVSCPTIAINSRGPSWDTGAYEFAAATQASPPSCSPGSGTYNANQTVTCTNPNAGTTLMCYSTSTTPATNGAGTGCTTGTQYTTALTVSANETLNVIAGTSTLTDSAVVTYSYVLQGGAPVCSPVGGTYIGTQSVALSQPQSLAIGYTTNGTSPVSNGSGGCSGSCTLYSGAISVASSETIKSIGMASGWTDSSIASCAYVINAPAATDMTMKGVTSSQGVTIAQ